jgi:hypothetical protein
MTHSTSPCQGFKQIFIIQKIQTSNNTTSSTYWVKGFKPMSIFNSIFHKDSVSLNVSCSLKYDSRSIF